MEGTSYPENNRIHNAQANVREVVGIMKTNVAKILERDHKLSDLGEKAEVLSVQACQFEQHAIKLKRKMWWKNLKFTLILGLIVGVLVLMLIIWIVRSFGDSNENATPPVTSAPATNN